MQSGESRRPAFYRPELDVLRFIAFLLVFTSHLLPRDRGSLSLIVGERTADLAALVINATGFGLSLFFFLSAYLITALLVREAEATGRIDLRRFYVRRCLRIWPLYYVALCIAVIYEIWAMTQGAGPGHWRMILMYAFFVGNWYYQSSGVVWPVNPMTPLWSISIEEQFYLLWPLLIKVCGTRSIPILAALMLVVALVAEYALAGAQADKDTAVWTNTFVNFQFFAYGSLFAVGVETKKIPRIGRLTRLACLGIGVAAWLAANVLFRVKSIEPADSATSLMLGFMLVGAGCAALTFAIRDVGIRGGAFVHLGKISYGLYVYHLLTILFAGLILQFAFRLGHNPVIIIPKIAVALYLCIAFAELSYAVLEKPFLKRKERYTLIPSRPV